MEEMEFFLHKERVVRVRDVVPLPEKRGFLEETLLGGRIASLRKRFRVKTGLITESKEEILVCCWMQKRKSKACADLNATDAIRGGKGPLDGL
jgi:hypothetical protein